MRSRSYGRPRRLRLGRSWGNLPVPPDPLHWSASRTGATRRYTGAPMSKVCAVCGKGPSFGHNRSHSMVATKRRFNPNLQRVRVLLKGKPTRAYVCTRCLKSGKVEKAI
jgi:large subunit ribosomal protein L28